MIFIFDFDNTLIDYDSDDLVLNYLGKPLTTKENWNDYMRDTLLNANKDITPALRKIIIRPKYAHFLNTNNCAIATDSNTYFIETILQNNNITGVKILSNKSEFVDGVCKITYPDNMCSLCKKYNCKGKLIKQFTEDICFIGDGFNDICAAINSDFVFARKGYKLAEFYPKFQWTPENLISKLYVTKDLLT